MEQYESSLCQNSKEEDNFRSFELEAFIKEKYNDSLILLSKLNYHQIQRPLCVLFHHFKIKGMELKQWIDKIYEISLQFPKTIRFALMDFEDASIFHLSWTELNHFDFTASTPPNVYAVDADEHQLEFDEEFSTTNLRRFCEYIEKNELYYSEPIPTEKQPGLCVEVIVADNFKQLVEQNKRDVFVTLHSKESFSENLELLGEFSSGRRFGVACELKLDNDLLIFYGINAYTNYIPLEYKVTELPTSFFIPCNDKSKRLRYVNKFCDGIEILKFVAKNASTELKTIDRKGCYKNPDVNKQNKKPKVVNRFFERFETVVGITLAKSRTDKDGFYEFLDSILKKANPVERNNIEMELVTIAMKRINQINNKRI